MNYIKITITGIEQEAKDVLVATLSELGYEGFEELPQLLHAFIPENQFDENALKEVLQELSFSKELIKEQNWNAAWEKDFQPVYVGDFCGIRASFHEPKEGVAYDIVITPKMSFGTGHHATTFMMVEWMEELSFKGKTVLDFGTGTGVLAILAEKLGASSVLAIDNDDWSIDNAKETIADNGCHKIALQQADHLAFEEKFDILLANINKNVLLLQMNTLQQHLTPGGVIIMSGLLAGDRVAIEEEAGQNNLFISGQKQKNGWISLELKELKP